MIVLQRMIMINEMFFSEILLYTVASRNGRQHGVRTGTGSINKKTG